MSTTPIPPYIPPNSTPFGDVYLRASLACDGTVPYTQSYSDSPDFFSNGTHAVPDYKTALATPASYSTAPDDNSICGAVNYCYLRCKNPTSAAVDATAQLFYTEASVVVWPDFWTPVETDVDKSTINTITAIPAGGIGVADHPFIWNKPESPRTNDHYCLIGRLSTKTNENPLPSPTNPIYMSDLIQNNLMYAQRNINITPYDPTLGGGYSVLLTVGKGVRSATSNYHLFFNSKNLTNWYVEITCSETDANGKQIGIGKTAISETESSVYCGSYVLEPGFVALATVYLYNPYAAPLPPDATTSLSLDYYSTDASEHALAQKLGVLDTQYSDVRRKAAKENDSNGQFFPLGSYHQKSSGAV